MGTDDFNCFHYFSIELLPNAKWRTNTEFISIGYGCLTLWSTLRMSENGQKRERERKLEIDKMVGFDCCFVIYDSIGLWATNSIANKCVFLRLRTQLKWWRCCIWEWHTNDDNTILQWIRSTVSFSNASMFRRLENSSNPKMLRYNCTAKMR